VNDNDSRQSEADEALNNYIERLLAEQKAAPPAGLAAHELAPYILAAEMKSLRPGADEPDEAFLRRLKTAVDQARSGQQPRTQPVSRRRMSRSGFLRAVGTLAAGVLVGVAVDYVLEPSHAPLPPLVENGRWYLLGASADLLPGSVHRFSAGGVDGYLFNENGVYRAVSAICTHMGCHINWHQETERFYCLCHNAQFKRDGTVAAGIPPRPLPEITVHVEGGNVYVWGTQQSTWGVS
jgi:cytochrome b6-f complex iron-sulfur subunit